MLTLFMFWVRKFSCLQYVLQPCPWTLTLKAPLHNPLRQTFLRASHDMSTVSQLVLHCRLEQAAIHIQLLLYW